MVLELSGQQARELSALLDAHLRELYDEVAHADHRAYRDELKQRIEQLEQVQHRLQSALSSSEAYA